MGKTAAIQHRKTGAIARGAGVMTRPHADRAANAGMRVVEASCNRDFAAGSAAVKTGHRPPILPMPSKPVHWTKGVILLTCGVYANVIRFLSPVTLQDPVFQEALDLLEASTREVHAEIGATA